MIEEKVNTIEVFLTNFQDNPNKVKAALILAGVSQYDIARERNIQVAEVSKVVNGKRETAHIQLAIAQSLGVATTLLFE